MDTKPVRTMIRQHILALLLISPALLTAADPAQAEENPHHSHMQHESHSQHQVSDVQLGHIHHVHKAGSWMFEYRFMRMEMEDLLAGSNKVSATDVAKMGSIYKNASGGTYMMAPTDMTMDMHMLMGMYSQTDDLSWMLMLNYLDNEMNMVAMSGAKSVMNSSGLGDVELGAMYKLYDKDASQLLANLGLSFPTGSINKINSQGILPYAMQLGSGTYDLKPSVTYRNNFDRWSMGFQGSYTFRLNKNDQNYDLGNRANGQAWLKVNPFKGASISGRVTFSDWQSINGSARDITAMRRNMSPTFDDLNSGGQRWDASIGISYMFESGHMLGAEYGLPIQQDLDGLQMRVKQVYNLSWQYIF